MDLLVIGLAVHPTAKDDANPFESESADGGRVLEAAAAHLIVVGASPGRVSDGLSGELVKGLSDEMGASRRWTRQDLPLFLVIGAMPE